MEKSTFESLGGSYIRVGDYLFPDLIIADETPLGKWGLLRKQYLKEHRPALCSSMLLTGKLDHHLAEIDRAGQERMDLIVAQLHNQEGITESLKRSDQMEWVQRVNSIRHRAEEIVLSELVFTI
ncbi:MAG: TnpV protein [Oscillospiraceae bacterium]|nr:TnpV protein [Oscillospiraceae bacterium]